MRSFEKIMMVTRQDMWRHTAAVPHARSLGPLVICLTVILLLLGCASPREELWPPRPGSLTHPIYVSLDTWHAMIAFPPDTPDASRFTPHAYEEWGYAERAWYLEGRTGLTGIIRALFWPTEGVIEVGYHDKLWADRTSQPPSTSFKFDLSEEGHRRLRKHLRATMAGTEPITSTDGSRFYPAVRAYHLFHTSHQYAAEALYEAGLPVSPFWAFSRSTLAMQLRRAEDVEEKGAVKP
jgi:hypothetical protein